MDCAGEPGNDADESTSTKVGISAPVSRSFDLDADDVANRASAETIAGHDEAQRVVWKRRTVELVGEKNLSFHKFRRDLSARDHGTVTICSGNANRQMRLLPRIGAIND